MDMATIFGRYERANGRLDDMEVSDEINACSVEIEVDVNGVKEPWLLMFKNRNPQPPNGDRTIWWGCYLYRWGHS